MNEEIIEKELRSEEVTDILQGIPSWFVRFGITSFFLIIVTILVFAWFIKYSDVVPARINIITEHSSVRIVTRTSGKIVHLFVKDQQIIEEDMLLAVLESPASWENVLELERYLDQFTSTAYLIEELPRNLILGSLDIPYNELNKSIKDLQNYEKRNNEFVKIESIKEQILNLLRLNSSIEKQVKLFRQEVKIIQEHLKRQKELLEFGSVSKVDVEQATSRYLEYQRQLESLEIQMINNDIRVKDFELQIVELTQSRTNILNTRYLQLEESIENLRNSINEWKQRYLLTTPVSGRISMSKIWNLNQFVGIESEIMTVVPHEGMGKIVGKAILPIVQSGKVEIGMLANIQLDGFPYQEFGVLIGTIETISLVPENDNYLLEISLPQDFITTYKKKVHFKQEMQGTAQIITERRRILSRVFDEVLNLFKNT